MARFLAQKRSQLILLTNKREAGVTADCVKAGDCAPGANHFTDSGMAYADGETVETLSAGAPSLERCGLAAAVELVGDRWTLLILRSALYGVTRFDDMHSSLGLPRTVLSNRLKKLVENDLLRKRPYKEDGQRTRHQYVLTSKGVDLALPLIALMQWGEKHILDAPGKTSLVERGAGAPLHAGLISEDGRPVDLRQAQFRMAS
jgi:DNA-binding HxlR family transcriptional regulator